jgi:hypothetical protein
MVICASFNYNLLYSQQSTATLVAQLFYWLSRYPQASNYYRY